MSVRDLVYGVYEKRLAARLDRDKMPRHVGVIMDGNRRWAKAVGEQIATGHQRGADKIHDLLGWCEEAGVQVVTLWLFSTDNFNRPAEELADTHSTIYVDRPLPERFRAGHTLTAADVEELRVLLARRDQHNQRLYRDNTALTRQLEQAQAALHAGRLGRLRYFVGRLLRLAAR